MLGFNDSSHVDRHSLAFSGFSLFYCYILLLRRECVHERECNLCSCVSAASVKCVAAVACVYVCVYLVHAGDLSKSVLARATTTVES